MMMYRLLAVSKRLRVPVVFLKPLYRLEMAPSLSFHSTRVLSKVLPTPQENRREPSVLYAMWDHHKPARAESCRISSIYEQSCCHMQAGLLVQAGTCIMRTHLAHCSQQRQPPGCHKAKPLSAHPARWKTQRICYP